MRKLNGIRDIDVYQICITSIQNKDLSHRLNNITNEVVSAAETYKQHADKGQLYTITPSNGNDSEVIVGEVTKKELKDIYTQHMVVKTKPAREIYDQLLSLAPLGKCPFCGFGQASTLDHYLSKSKYPLLSVLTLNLVPSCKDCNTGKGNKTANTAEEQCLHPYFDHQHFIDEQWLYAKVEETNPASIQFYVQPPEHWDEQSKERVKSHFKDFQLAKRYATEAATELSIQCGTLIRHQELGSERVREHLKIMAKTLSETHKNSWKTALFQALEASNWYCDGGYNS